VLRMFASRRAECVRPCGREPRRPRSGYPGTAPRARSTCGVRGCPVAGDVRGSASVYRQKVDIAPCCVCSPVGVPSAYVRVGGSRAVRGRGIRGRRREPEAHVVWERKRGRQLWNGVAGKASRPRRSHIRV